MMIYAHLRSVKISLEVNCFTKNKLKINCGSQKLNHWNWAQEGGLIWSYTMQLTHLPGWNVWLSISAFLVGVEINTTDIKLLIIYTYDLFPFLYRTFLCNENHFSEKVFDLAINGSAAKCRFKIYFSHK